MTIRTELCQFTTADGETLHGLLFQPEPDAVQTDLALVLVHGVGMNFYIGPLPTVGQMLAERGYHVLTMNTRGHDWVSRAGDLTAFGGAAYERLEDHFFDLDAALGWLSGRGFRRFVLFGHSLGAVKSLWYQGVRQRPDVVGLVSCSAPKQFYRARAEEQADFEERLALAEQMIAEGRGDEFLWAPTSGAQGLFTARTYENKYGRHERNDVRPRAAELPCPLLATAGGIEHPFFPTHARELVEAAGPERGTLAIIEDAEHMYKRYETVLTDTVEQWLRRVVA